MSVSSFAAALQSVTVGGGPAASPFAAVAEQPQVLAPRAQTPRRPAAGGSGDLPAFMRAVADVESGGRYHIRGPQTRHGRPVGAYQILDANWDAWAADAGVPGADWRDPAAQDRVAEHKMLAYYRQFGRWDAVAVAWFAGPGRAARYVRDPQSVASLADVLGTDVASYVERVTGGMATQRGRATGARRVAPAKAAWTSVEVGQAGQTLADAFGLRMTSHHRSPERNRQVGGAPRSDHLRGYAVDLAGSRDAMRALVDWAEQFTGPEGPFRIVLHPWNDAAHDDHVHISWRRGTAAAFQLPGGPPLSPAGFSPVPVDDLAAMGRSSAQRAVDGFAQALAGGGAAGPLVRL